MMARLTRGNGRRGRERRDRRGAEGFARHGFEAATVEEIAEEAG
jgi:AcrR family transcriptional regulator